MIHKHLFPAALALFLVGCSSFAPERAPTVVQGHVGQVIAASSSIADGKSLLAHASSIVDSVLTVNRSIARTIEREDFIAAKRQAFNLAEIVDPSPGNSSAPGLKDALRQGIFHIRQLATPVASDPVSQKAASIAEQAGITLQEAGTLTTYVNFALNADSSESLMIISGEIDNTARKLAGMSPQSGVYSLVDMRNDLEQMLAVEGKALDSDDIWYLQNFSYNDSVGKWQFARKPVEKRRDMFASDNDSPTTSPGGGDDDDDDDDD